jgi:hypothetical protein
VLYKVVEVLEPDATYRTISVVPVVLTQKLVPSLTALSITAPDIVSVKAVLITRLSQASIVAIVRTFVRALGDAVPEDTL